jgi:hypothetical protein
MQGCATQDNCSMPDGWVCSTASQKRRNGELLLIAASLVACRKMEEREDGSSGVGTWANLTR